MLNFSSAEESAKLIAKHYCQHLNNPEAVEFFSGNLDISSKAQALSIAKVFWEITDMASEDHLNDINVLGDLDIEFWMHKLFNKTYGYFQKNGYVDEWRLAEAENS
jgi:hypothetical protein